MTTKEIFDEAFRDIPVYIKTTKESLNIFDDCCSWGSTVGTQIFRQEYLDTWLGYSVKVCK